MKRLLRQIILLSIVVCRHAWSANVPLVPWELTRTGNGSVNISTNSDLSQISFNVQNNASGTGGTYGYATSTTSLGTITSNTIYVLSSSANLWGPGTGGMALLANGVGVAGVGVPTTSPGSFANYTASFTTGGPGDPHIGQGLQVQFNAGGYNFGNGAIATFNNITVNTYPLQPTLAVTRTNSSQMQISWPNFYTGFTLESASNIAGSWIAVTNPVVSQSGNFVVAINTTSPQQSFFRLRK
jgi:hypothetical protein